ncbi:alginate lyase family protein [Sungkyunkwania multivorans]|uniref:Alginate lyase family protein n=1 Tax=Sungkyunkwania multivorans TaxID=1173618 RepID=A0ABW3D246_9FLAO
MNIKTVLSKPIPVVWYRFKQLVKLKYYHRTKFWDTVENLISDKIEKEGTHKSKSGLFHADFSGYDQRSSELNQTILADASRILAGSIAIFDTEYTFEFPIRWNSDWRSGHTWKNKYYKGYSFYKPNKEKEYDVKFPWELSRLSFLIAVARSYLLTKDEKYLTFVRSTLEHWKTKNPIAHSVNWYPMEVAIRTINLVQLRELLLRDDKADKTIDLLNEILLLHGIFLWRNVEYTDLRGNHYAANLTALLLLGKIFKDFFKEARNWYRYAIQKTENEFHLQFLKDGVNFEKSIPYHRLVVELFFVSFLAMKRSGIQLRSETLTLLRNANRFMKAVTKPNSETPIIGDNDSASIFQNDAVSLNDHSNILQLISLFLEDDGLNIAKEAYLSSRELFGIEETKAARRKEGFQLDYFEEGGFVIAKTSKDYFIADYGEVGMHGRGGHGHNDLFSFELMLDGKDIIVDPGCYTYTGDLALKSKMKSSAYHNGLMVDGQEIAPQIGQWGISDIANPLNVRVLDNANSIEISGEHKGYDRLSHPVGHRRVFKLTKNNFKLTCNDHVNCESKHEITRHLHFSKEVDVSIENTSITVMTGESKFKIQFDEQSTASVGEYYFSSHYGSKSRTSKVTLKTFIAQSTNLFFTIEKVSNQ